MVAELAALDDSERRLRRGRPISGDNAAGLSPRELQALRLVARGASNAEIAAQLAISIRTAEQHVASATHKLGAANRAEAVWQATRAGLLHD